MRNPITVVTFLLLSAAALDADTVARHRFQSSLATTGIEEVVIDIPASQMKITNGESGLISLRGTAEKEYHGINGLGEARRAADAATVRVEKRGSRAVVQRILGPAARSRSWTDGVHFEFELLIPKGMSLRVEQQAGEVEIDGEFGDLEVEMKAGEVSVRTPRRAVRELSVRAYIGEVKTNLGDKIISKEGILAGRTEYFNEGGRSSVTINLAVGEIDIVLVE